MQERTKQRVGRALNLLISIALIVSGILKLVGVAPYQEMIQELSPNYYSNIYLLGIIAILSGVLFLIPRTFIFGFIASLVFLGGTISAHMQHGDNYAPQLVFVLITITASFLLKREWYSQQNKQ